MTLKKKHLFWICALLAAISFDLLFWDQPFGINFFIFVLFATLGGLIPMWIEKIKIPWTSYLLLIPVGFFSAMTFIRAEPFTTLMNGLLTISALILFSITLRNGSWHKYRLRDHLVNWVHFFLNTFIGGILFFNKVKTKTSPHQIEDQASSNRSHASNSEDGDENKGEALQKSPFLKQIAPYLRGLVIALPILLILAFFLAQADPIFSDRIQSLFSHFRLENLGETLFRFVYILLIAYALLSTYYFAFVESEKFQVENADKPAINPFFGSIETSMILGTVNILFLLFVILQFSYLFNGGKNISAEGYTYAEYARRGFFELLIVAVISLVLFYTLSIITKREKQSHRRLFSILGLTLVGLVAIILVSAYTRLTLYEMAYGFTRLRTLAHIFMIWVGLLLVSIATLEISKKITKLAFILICFILGFGLTINLLNIDQFIVQQNVTRALADPDGEESNLDLGYLYTLSHDAIPKLVAFIKDPSTPEMIRDDIGGVLACKSATLDDPQEITWVSYHYARNTAVNLLVEQSEQLQQYPLSYDMGTWFVEVNGEVRSCNGYDYD